MRKPVIVVSGVNFTSMGPLAVMNDALAALFAGHGNTHQIMALVHDRRAFHVEGIDYREFPRAKASWLNRLKFEYWEAAKLSRRLQPDLWLSMHDITPHVHAKRQAVYCHNPSPFYKFSFRDLRLDWKFGLFTLFYGLIYAIRIRKNTFVIVQQDWIRQAFRRTFRVDNVVVAHPVRPPSAEPTHGTEKARSNSRLFRFCYPCFPRVFKNVETLLAAVELLDTRHHGRFELVLTFDGSENRYASWLVRKYGRLPFVRFAGLVPREAVFRYYATTDCLVFPSKLETWGMPISEFQQFGRPILAADLAYAHETVGAYEQAAYFKPDDPVALAHLMGEAISGGLQMSTASPPSIADPYCRSWSELFDLLLSPSPAEAVR